MSFIDRSDRLPALYRYRRRPAQNPRTRKSASSGDAQYTAVTLEGLEPST